MGGMGDMMRPPAAHEPLYPQLMRAPREPSQAERQRLVDRAAERQRTAQRALDGAHRALSEALARGDATVAHGAARDIALASDELGATLQAVAALTAGQAPADVALSWLRVSMSLTAQAPSPLHATRGFHWTVLALLAMFGLSFVWIAWDRRRRIAALIEALPQQTPARAAATDMTAPRTAALAEIPFRGKGAETSQTAAHNVDETVAASAPAGLPWRGVLRVAAVFDETHDVKTFRLMAPGGRPLPFTYAPGQYLTLHLPMEGAIVKRSYTIASSPSQRDYLELTVKREPAGRVSPYLHDRVAVGDDIDVSGPAGRFTFDGSAANCIVLIGGGVGITPLMSVLRHLTAHAWPGRIALLYACRTTDDFIFREELEYLQRRHPNLQVVATMTRGRGHAWMGAEGYPTAQRIRDAVPDIATQRVHVCGPPPMMDAVLAMLTELSVPRANIYIEKFGPDKRPRPPATSAASGTDAPASARFARSGRAAVVASGMSVLEAAESVGVGIDNACRSGTCGSCKVKLVSGSVSHAVDDALSADEKAAGWILACQAQAHTDVVIDA
jgi:ferredoxin-NADP reductase